MAVQNLLKEKSFMEFVERYSQKVYNENRAEEVANEFYKAHVRLYNFSKKIAVDILKKK